MSQPICRTVVQPINSKTGVQSPVTVTIMQRKQLAANNGEGVNSERAPLNDELSKGRELATQFGCCVRGLKEGVGRELEEQ